jgi:hypothetical protein
MGSLLWRCLLVACVALQISIIVLLHRPDSEASISAVRGFAKRLVSSVHEDDEGELELQKVAQHFDLVKVDPKEARGKLIPAEDDNINGDGEDPNVVPQIDKLPPPVQHHKKKKPAGRTRTTKQRTKGKAAPSTTATSSKALPHAQQHANNRANHGAPDQPANNHIQQAPGDAPSKFIDHKDGTCTPVKRFIYIKTHKSGSSTLTNIFHRFALSHDVPVALPKGNYFLGWPNSQKIPTCFVDLPGKPPQIWCSAHTRYDFKLLDGVIPGATAVTVLRNPVSHFLSSWNYWRTEDHIAENHPDGARPSVEEFVLNTDKWWPFAKRSDHDLLKNNAAFDLGLSRNASREDVEALISHLEKHFSLVLITEFMDESLVLLRRRFCWSLQDILYYGLKVSGPGRPKPAIAPAVKDAIRNISWMDVLLHDHFNRSLWAQIAQEQDFDTELTEYRRLKDQLHDECVAWQELGEDEHRKAVLTPGLTETERRCHLAQLDSAGFVRYLKELAGAADPECHTQGQPRRRVVFIKTHKTGGSTIANIMHRVALRLRARVALPVNNYYLGWPHKGNLQSAVAPLPRANGKPYEMFCSAHSRFDLPAMEALVPDAMYVTILRDPVKHFQSSWDYWHTADHIAARRGSPVTMEEYVMNPKAYEQYLQPSDINVLHNSMAFDLGLDHYPEPTQVDQLIMTMMNRFSLVMITDHMLESLVMLRRTLCWTIDDIVGLALKVSSITRASVSPEIATAIRALNWADARLFEAFNATLWYRIRQEVHFEEELAQFRTALAAAQGTCAPYAVCVACVYVCVCVCVCVCVYVWCDVCGVMSVV